MKRPQTSEATPPPVPPQDHRSEAHPTLGEWALSIGLSLLVFACLAAIAVRFDNVQGMVAEQRTRAELQAELGEMSRGLAAELNTALVELAGLGDWWALHTAADAADFALLSQRILGRHRALRSTTLLQGDVITRTYPENPKLIGLDVGGHAVQGRAVADMRRRRGPIVTGPVTLAQGGNALVLRHPVWSAREPHKPYLGHVSMVFDLGQLSQTLAAFTARDRFGIVLRDSTSAGHTAALYLPVRMDGLASATHRATLEFRVAHTRWRLDAYTDATAASAHQPWFLWALLLAAVASLSIGYLLLSRAWIRRTSEALRSSQTAALQSAEAKAAFVATVSHELRTPLNGIIATTQLLRESELDPAQRELADVLGSSADGLLSVINDVLDFSKLTSGKMALDPQPGAIRKVLSELHALMRHEAERKGISLEFHVDPDVPAYLLVDHARLRQVLLNLVGNGVKFTERGGVRVAVLPGTGSNSLRVEVRDDGVGIAAPERLFEAFQQGDASTSRKYGGTGLGLSICKQLVALMGGEIGVQSEPGRGSMFWFSLPAPSALPPHNIVPTQVSCAPGGRALVADDNAVNRIVARRVLQRFGWEVVLVQDGRAAVDAATQSAFDIVFMDCQMPLMDGYAAAKTLRQRGYARPIVALTANPEAEVADRCQAAGMSDFLAKPIAVESMAGLLSRLCEPQIDSAPEPHVRPK